ncbi:hypothetical protein BG003_003364 [Podila horticola]|nr:hypothetical protein BG003_003364 [Podila horticola]
MFELKRTTLSRLSPLVIPEILEHIFSYLDRATILQGTRRVCRQWYHISDCFYSPPLVMAAPFAHDKAKFFETLKQLPYARSFHWTTSSNYDHDEQWISVRNGLENKNKRPSSDTMLVGSAPVSPLHPAPLWEFRHSGLIFWSNFEILLPYFGSLTSLRLSGPNYGDALYMCDLLRSCPALEDLHLENQKLLRMQRDSDSLSSLNLDLAAQSPLMPTPTDNTLRLKSLTIKLCQVASSTLVDLLAVCPRLLKLEIVTNYVGDRPFWPLIYRTIEQDELLSFIGLACPLVRRLHYSITDINWSPGSLEALFKENAQVTEWSFLVGNLDPHLGSQLLQVRNVVTCLEICDTQQRGYHPLGRDLMDSGLHRFLCSAPLLRELKAAKVCCVASRLDPFPLELPAEPRQSSSPEAAVSAEQPRLWVCHNLEALELGFTGRFIRPYTSERLELLTPRDVRVVFGYLSGVCPRLRHVNISLDSAPLDLQSGLCLVSRLKCLETLTIEMPGTVSLWSRGTVSLWPRGSDLSWMEPPSFLGLFNVFQQQEMKKWKPLLQQEQELIQRRKAFLEQASMFRAELLDHAINTKDVRDDISRVADFAQLMVQVGTLSDVRVCMDEIARNRAAGSRLPTPRVVITSSLDAGEYCM